MDEPNSLTLRSNLKPGVEGALAADALSVREVSEISVTLRFGGREVKDKACACVEPRGGGTDGGGAEGGTECIFVVQTKDTRLLLEAVADALIPCLLTSSNPCVIAHAAAQANPRDCPQRRVVPVRG